MMYDLRLMIDDQFDRRRQLQGHPSVANLKS